MIENTTIRSGIYAITNMVNGKVYVGSTVDIQDRWNRHGRMLRGDYHGNPHLQHAWNKYGEDTFEFMVCEYVEDKEQLHVREQYWLDFHRMLTEVYNCGLVARHPSLGRQRAEETKRKISKAARKRFESPEARRKMSKAAAKPYPAFVHRYTGEIILAGVNLKAMCQERGLLCRGMRNVKTGQRRQHKGWVLLSEHSQPWLL